MSYGWVKLHRQLLENPIFKNDKLFRVFIYCLLKTSHTEHDQLVGDVIVPVKKGEFVGGRKAISSSTGLTEQNVRTALSKLEKLGILTIKPTNKFSLISISNWDKYQQDNQQVTSNQPTSNQQVTTNKNGKNVNNGDNHIDQSKIEREKLELSSFEFWWEVYPKKIAKKVVFKDWLKVIKKMDDKTVRDLTNHIANDINYRLELLAGGDSRAFGFDRLHPKTYLSQERYNDDI